uniref:Uncharacterized protein n=1 Tax=Glossina palpalis gambiensis TaxID=67801 RepID=A0A1B0C1I2_9MUSC
MCGLEANTIKTLKGSSPRTLSNKSLRTEDQYHRIDPGGKYAHTVRIAFRNEIYNCNRHWEGDGYGSLYNYNCCGTSSQDLNSHLHLCYGGLLYDSNVYHLQWNCPGN